MAALNFYNRNQHRAFPFTDGSVGLPLDGPATLLNLPPDVVVDAGFLLGPEAGFDSAAHLVQLRRIVRSGTTLTFEFDSTAPALYDVLLSFTRATTDPLYTEERVNSGDEGLSASSVSGGDAVCDEPLWSGYLVTGDLTALDEVLPGDGELVRSDTGDATVEPALLQNLRAGYVLSLNIANDDRTRALPDEECSATEWPYETGGVFVYQRCLTGEVVLDVGYNVTLDQTDDAVIVGAAVGAGLGEPCAEVPLFEDEEAPDGSVLLSGGLRCQDAIRAVSGVSGPVLALLAGNGVTVTASPEDHQLTVTVDMSNLALCANSESVSDISEAV